MKTLIITCLPAALLCAAFIYAQNLPQREGSSPQRNTFSRPGLERYFDKFGNNAFEMDRFENQAHPPFWLNSTCPFEKFRMGFPQSAFGRRSDMDRWARLPLNPSRWSQVLNSFGSVKEAWVRQYASELMPSADRAVDLAIDAAGYVYVTGYSQSVPGGYGYLTIKYDPAGKVVWSARYDSETPYGDYARALALDEFGNVYVTGSGAAGDCITVKYDSSGIKQWAVSYDGPKHDIDWPSDIAVDDSGNVYVTGASIEETGYQRNKDYVTIKYNASGAQKWVARYANTQGSEDYAVALAVDKQGNVYVSGTTGMVYVQQTNDYLTVKYSPSGTQEWVARYNGPANQNDFGNAIAVDPFVNVFVTGSSQGDYVTVKYNSSGVEEWTASYNGPANRSDEASAIAIDDAGNVCITGRSMGPGSPSNPYDYDYCTIKYNRLGVQEWVERYDAGENCDSEPTAFTLDQAGNLYVTGSIGCPGTSADYGTVKYSSLGTRSWEARYAGPSNSQDNAVALAVDGAGNVYIDLLGYVYVTGISGWEATTVKYSPAGTQEWVVRHPKALGRALAIDDSGNVYVAGVTWAGISDDYLTIKYSTSGVEKWVALYDGPGFSGNHYYPSQDEAVAIAVDGLGSVYITGESSGNGGYAAVKYNSVGATQWVRKHSGPMLAHFRPTSPLAVDASGNVYLVGTGTGNSFFDFVTLKYDSAGNQEWIIQYNGPGKSNDYVTAVAVDDFGNVYVIGTNTGEGTWSTWTTIKYVQTPVSVKEKEPNQPTANRLVQNYPNPFNPSTTIRYTIAKPGHVTLKVFNVQGQEIAALVNENKPAGEYEVKWKPTNVPSGVYVYRLQAGEFVETKKLILMK
jgi:hypothetical protein